MIEHFFGSTENLILLLLSLIFRIFRSTHDGLSDRAKFFYSRSYAPHLYGEVGAWPWHLVNWLGRDFFIALLYFHLLYRSCPWQTIFAFVIFNWILHDLFYWWTATHRDKFKWGYNWPKFPSLFRDIFKHTHYEQR